jgi:hypothetical protein
VKLLAVVAALAVPARAADKESLHAAIQGRWHADNKAVAEQVPGWKTMSAKQRETVLAILPPLDFEITADRIILKAAGNGEPDEPLPYTINGVEGQKLKLTGKDASGEQKPFTIEVAGPDAIVMTSAEGAALRLARVKPESPRP